MLGTDWKGENLLATTSMMEVIFFIYDLFNDTVCVWNYITPNCRMISVQWIRKDLTESSPKLISGIILEMPGMQEVMKNLTQDRYSFSWLSSNWATLKFKSQPSSILKNRRTQRFGNWFCFCPQVRGQETPTQLGPLERTSLNHWTDLVSTRIAYKWPITGSVNER
jgi:hypothetical protein